MFLDAKEKTRNAIKDLFLIIFGFVSLIVVLMKKDKHDWINGIYMGIVIGIFFSFVIFWVGNYILLPNIRRRRGAYE